jgi:hypothetical protein
VDEILQAIAWKKDKETVEQETCSMAKRVFDRKWAAQLIKGTEYKITQQEKGKTTHWIH